MSQEFDQFRSMVAKVISVPKAEILHREAEYQKTVDSNPNRRGPKRKPKSSVGPVPVAS
jgi:hypothetical protein